MITNIRSLYVIYITNYANLKGTLCYFQTRHFFQTMIKLYSQTKFTGPDDDDDDDKFDNSNIYHGH